VMSVTQALSGAVDVELPVERVSIDDGRPAAVDAGTAFVADLRLDPGETRQTRNPVRAAYLALVEKDRRAACDNRRPCRSLPMSFRSSSVCRLSSLARLLSGFFSQV
jgi:hypothetical protein